MIWSVIGTSLLFKSALRTKYVAAMNLKARPKIALPLAAVCLLMVTAIHAGLASKDVIFDMKRVADWQLEHPSQHPIYDWTQAPFFLGLFNLHQVTGDAHYLDALTDFGVKTGFGPGPRLTHADDHAVLQAWLELHQLTGDKARLQPSIDHFEKLGTALAGKSGASAGGGSFTWCWCDALFMSPQVWAHLSRITGDAKYLDFSDREWWTTTDVLYDPEACLYYRDNNFFGKRTESGRKVFWARGNGWVIGGLVRMLDLLPADHPSRLKYLGLYHDMMHAILKIQGPDGLWRTSLLDPEQPMGEASGTAFFTYGMAWGLNRGLLPEREFRPALEKAWNALHGCIQNDGMLGFVQRIGDRPGEAKAVDTEVYGSGALLLAGSEIVRLLDPAKRRDGLAKFDGVKLTERYLREVPRVRARFVPERSDDFAWENDLTAFRTYGPALRPGPENSGIDLWVKRVSYPVMDKWYVEDRTRLPYGNVAKSYHQDHGEGNDCYKVGDARGCGGASLWVSGALHNSDAFVGHKMIADTPDKAVFELHYASRMPDGRVAREAKRITFIMGKRLFQSESRFTIDGKPGKFDVAIGLLPQQAGTKPLFQADKGTAALWENVEGYGLGTAVVIDPGRVSRMIEHTDAAGTRQALVLATTDASGYIRWYSGYGWEGQGVIMNAAQWNDYLKAFAKEIARKPFADHSADPAFTVPELDVP
jgi:unsaturated rhamnogalacturonyl hydrolase